MRIAFVGSIAGFVAGKDFVGTAVEDDCEFLLIFAGAEFCLSTQPAPSNIIAAINLRLFTFKVCAKEVTK